MGCLQKMPDHVEVLNPSTELFDRRKKPLASRRFQTLESCVIVSFDQRTMAIFTCATGWARTLQTEPVHSLFDEVTAA